MLDLLPDVEIVFTCTTTILLKACREKRKILILCFNYIKSKRYYLNLKNDSDLLGVSDNDWIILGDENDG